MFLERGFPNAIPLGIAVFLSVSAAQQVET